MRGLGRRAAALLLSAVSSASCIAAADPLQDIRAQLQELKAAQESLADQQRKLEEAVQRVEAELRAGERQEVAPPVVTAAPGKAASPLHISGDFRFRGQGDYSDRAAPSHDSLQVRGRLGATYVVSDLITLGARLATGDPDDPNSSDVQLSNFDDDLQASLDLAYIQFNLGDTKLYAGKIPQPFVRTDLVWDSDVNPQGLGGVYRKAFGNQSILRASALYFLIDERAAGPDSTMLGAQLGYEFSPASTWRAELNAAYYDFTLRSFVGGDSGDFRSNRFDAQGRYVSDFDLVDLVAAATWSGLGARWPVRIVGDFVRNQGARSGDDTGYGVDLTLGRFAQKGDWRVNVGYASTDRDAVLAAFSHDNIAIGTNYDLRTLGFDYRLASHLSLNALWYHYRNRGSNDWLDRLRLSLLVDF